MVTAAKVADDLTRLLGRRPTITEIGLAARDQRLSQAEGESSLRREMVLSEVKIELMFELGRQPTSEEMVAAANAKLTARRSQ